MPSSLPLRHSSAHSPAESLASRLDRMADDVPGKIAFRFLADGESDERVISFSALAERARKMAGGMRAMGWAGEPVILHEAPGIDFIAALFGCWYAGVLAVPAYPPGGNRQRKRLGAVIADSGASAGIGADSRGLPEGFRCVSPEALVSLGEFFDAQPATGDDPCLLQYTSGSTASPKGVVIRQRNLSHNLSAISATLGDEGFNSPVSWLPPYHDMGLVLKILLAVRRGVPLTFFTPDQFIQRPARWLRAISKYGGDFSGGPNFAFDLCAKTIGDDELEGVDLSCWKGAPVGAERVREETLERFAARFSAYGFRKEAFMPGYGLAESTLVVTGMRKSGEHRVSGHPLHGRHVSCGSPVEGVRVRIADPEDGSTLVDGNAGEIRVGGPSVSSGYWKDRSSGTFADGELRTGDLGYLENGELHVIGRIKDLIIIGGVNHSPEDIEAVVLSNVPEVSAAVAFSVETGGGEGVCVAVERRGSSVAGADELFSEIAKTVASAAGLAVDRLVLVRGGTLPRTTSGKMKRHAAREAFESGSLAMLAEREISDADMNAADTLPRFMEIVREVTGRTGFLPSDDAASSGITSIEATRILAMLRAEGIGQAGHADFYSAPSFAGFIHSLHGAPEIERVDEGQETGVLTHSQERMWFLHKMEPESAAYHVFGALEFTGGLDADRLGNAFGELVLRHRILRTQYSEENGEVRMMADLKGAPEMEKCSPSDKDELHRRVVAFAEKPFDLTSGFPIRAFIADCGADRHVVAVCLHHIAADGWSIRVLLDELKRIYEGTSGGDAADADYIPHAAWHRKWIDGGAAEGSVSYWQRILSGHPGMMNLTTDFQHPLKPSSAGGWVDRVLPPDLVGSMERLAASRKGTPFMVQMAAFLLLLRRHGAGNDQVIAVPVANRNHAGTGNMIGTLVNTLPFRLSIDGKETGFSLVDRVREACFGMQEAQDAPFEKILEAVKPERIPGRPPLCQVMFDHQEIPHATEWSGGLRCGPYFVHRGAAQFELSLMSFLLPEGQRMGFEYRSDLFGSETAEAMLERYLGILSEMCAHPGKAVGSIEGLTAADRTKLRNLENGPVRPDFTGATTLSLFQETVRRFPDRTAVVCGSEVTDYASLDRHSSALAKSLVDAGAASGGRIALLLERDKWLVVSLLAVWKAGCAYVPLDPANPPDRISLILEDQKPVTVLVSPAYQHIVPESIPAVVFSEEMAAGDGVSLAASPSLDDPAYILYTSGSTGKPKGVVVSQKALANFLRSMAEEPGFPDGGRLMAVTTISFDISALEIHLPLIRGGTVDLVASSDARDGRFLASRIRETEPDVLQATPATWRMLFEAGWQGDPKLKILCGGEAMDIPLAEKLVMAGAEAWNLYGPTETTVWSTVWKLPASPRKISIGRAIANTGIHVVSEDGTLLPPGVPGDLLISGDGLAEGYWMRPDLTEAAFVDGLLDDGPKVYRTGDQAKWLADGTLECLGRNDGQVKIRGFRIELGEIDAALLSHPDVAEAATVLSKGEDRLAAFYRSGAALSADDLVAYLRTKLPDYMLPSPLVAVDAMPLTSSGKIDRKKLAGQVPEMSVSSGGKAPGDVLEAELLLVWSDVLGCGPVGPDDDFFLLGGHSLLAVRLVSEVNARTGISVPLDWLFQRPTPSGMAARIRSDSSIDFTKPRAIPLQSGKGGRPLFWIQTLVDGGMGLLPYRIVAGLLSTESDSYGMAEGTGVFGSFREMAAAHVDAIRAVQPEGPYRLAGFCFGGNLAAEIACQLEDAGEKIEMLFLLEASPPWTNGGAAGLASPSLWMRALKRLPERIASLTARRSGEAFRRVRMKGASVVSWMGRILGAREVPDIRGVLDMDVLDEDSKQRAEKHWTALHHHRPRLPRATDLVIVKAADQGWLAGHPTLGWKPRGKTDVRTVRGRHEDFLRGDSSQEIAEVMKQVLGGK